MIRHDAIDTMNRLGADARPFLFLIDFDRNKPWVWALDKGAPPEVYVDFPTVQFLPTVASPQYGEIEWTIEPPTYKQFLKAYEGVQHHIHQGDTYLLNLCFRSHVQTNLSLQQIFEATQAKYKVYFKNRFVSFSPETFIRIQGHRMSTFPMKGTWSADHKDAAQELLSDPKENAEHATIVDLLRNDLSIHAKKVRVDRYKYLDQLDTNRGAIWQMSSEISGVLPNGFTANIGDIVWDMLPAGSISGAPKPRTVSIIRDQESFKRGYYTGIFGYFDGKNMDTAVLIRYIERSRGQFFYKSGGGITFQSDPKREYEELIQKIYLPLL